MENLKQQCLLLIICMLSVTQVQAANVGFSLGEILLEEGETIEVSIFAENFEELAGGTIDFSLSSLSSVSVADVTIDSLWDFSPAKGELDGNTWKGIGFDVFNHDVLKGNGLIATVSLTGLGAGTTTLALLDSSTFFSTTVELDSAAIVANSSIDITVQDVSQVPLPTAAWFMGSALIGLIGLKRKSS